MPPAPRPARRRAAATLSLSTLSAAALCLSALTGAALAGATAAQAATPKAAGHSPLTAITRTVSASAQRATRGFWTPKAMEAATPLPRPEPLKAAARATRGAPATPKPAIPHPKPFKGVPTVGTLFLTTGNQAHFCTASVVNSLTANLVITAAHCVYGSKPVSHVVFVPEYHYGQEPYGAWPVETVTVAAGWQKSHDPDLDFAFLKVAPPAGSHVPIQFVTGGLWLGIDQGYTHPIFVIGYNDTDNYPIGCATHSSEFRPGQMQFVCAAYWDGTSGGPWITDYNASNGTGVVIGVIGGYEEGGLVPWKSYSTYFGLDTLKLFVQAEKAQA